MELAALKEELARCKVVAHFCIMHLPSIYNNTRLTRSLYGHYGNNYRRNPLTLPRQSALLLQGSSYSKYNQLIYIYTITTNREKTKHEMVQEKLAKTLRERDAEIDSLRQVRYLNHTSLLMMALLGARMSRKDS